MADGKDEPKPAPVTKPIPPRPTPSFTEELRREPDHIQEIKKAPPPAPNLPPVGSPEALPPKPAPPPRPQPAVTEEFRDLANREPAPKAEPKKPAAG